MSATITGFFLSCFCAAVPVVTLRVKADKHVHCRFTQSFRFVSLPLWRSDPHDDIPSRPPRAAMRHNAATSSSNPHYPTTSCRHPDG
ncbi:hypothetical protein BC835DRAFT_437514 [Cytidiella melzeri]|nr:hypothetical protein BC835DRAFT_437514 [Cytidiella melzeri]